MSRERNSGWERVRSRGKAIERDRVSFNEDPRWTHAGNRDGQQQGYNRANWRDKKDISSFYFTRFSEDVTEKDLWYHFKKWGDVRETFISKQKNKNGRRYGFARFKGVKDVHKLERQLDQIVIGGQKLYVNIPKMGERWRERMNDAGGSGWRRVLVLLLGEMESSLRTGHRLAWVQCWGISLLAWETTYIQKILAAIGDMVEVDDDVDKVRKVDRAKVLIRTPWSPTIQHTISVYIGGGRCTRYR
uniref:RRM domain-containing protein n=1 Tax=Glycine max TaxID=3847 RepID=K7N556_SOYBN